MQCSLETEATAGPARQWPILEGSDTPKLVLALSDGGGPPANSRPPIADATVGDPGGRRAGRAGGGYGGYLEQKLAKAASPAEAPNGRGGLRSGAEAYQRIRQLGVNHLIGVAAGGAGGPWSVESVRRAVQTAKDNGCVAYNAMLDAPESVRHGKPDRAKDLEQYIASVEARGQGRAASRRIQLLCPSLHRGATMKPSDARSGGLHRVRLRTGSSH